MSDASTAGIILAGGASRRMGRDKALLPLPGHGDVTFVEHLASLLRPLCSEVLVVVRDEASAAHYRLQGVRLVADHIPDQGPLMGLYSGLSAMRAPRALVLAVDMPFVEPALLTFLLTQPLTNELVVPLVGGVPQVLLALYPHSILPVIEECLQQGRRDPRALLKVAPVRYFAETQLRQIDPQLRSFINVNTPTELFDANGAVP